MTTIGEVTSRLRNIIKGVREDAFLTDRFLYSMVLKNAKALIRRQDNESKIMNIRSLFETVPCVDLEETSTIEACCAGVTDCTIMRTKEELPAIVDGSKGPLIRGVSTIDNSEYFLETSPQIFVSIASTPNYKYNKTKYYWYLNRRLYFPNVPYDAVNVEAMWEDSVSYLQCDDSEKCLLRQDEASSIPDYLYAEIDMMVLKELGIMIQLPPQPADDKQSNLRT